MDKILEILAQNGPFAIMCGILLYLLIRVLNRVNEITKEQLQAQVADTAAKSKLTDALEDVVATVEALGQAASSDIGGCKNNVNEMLSRINSYLEECKLREAKEEGRREATDPRFRIPTGEDHE